MARKSVASVPISCSSISFVYSLKFPSNVYKIKKKKIYWILFIFTFFGELAIRFT